MDPVTAIALAVKAIAELITEAIKGQPPEVRAQMWIWWMETEKWWRALLLPNAHSAKNKS